MRWQPAPLDSAALILAGCDIDVWWRPSLDHGDHAASGRNGSESLTREILSRYLARSRPIGCDRVARAGGSTTWLRATAATTPQR